MSEEAVVEEVVATETVTETPVEAPVAPVEAQPTPDTPVTPEASEEAFADVWLGKLENEELKGDKTLERLKGKSADEVAQYIKELVAWNGRKGDIPADDATDEVKEAFAIKMGRPETQEGYDFSLNADFSELVGEDNVPYYESKVEWFKEQAFANGLSADKAATMLEGYFEMMAGDINGVSEVATKQATDAQATIDKEWGESKNFMETSIDAMMVRSGADLEALKASGALQDPNIALALGRIAKDLADGPEIGHKMAQTKMGQRDQLAEVNAQVSEMIANGNKVPDHLKTKRLSLMKGFGDEL